MVVSTTKRSSQIPVGLSVSRAVDLLMLESHLSTRISETSARLYRAAVSRWFNAIGNSVPTRELAQAYVDKLARTRSPNTAALHAHAIMRYFEWKGQSIDLECPKIPAPKPHYLSMEQIHKVISSCRTLLERVLVVVLFDTAVRISELLNLKVGDVDYRNGFITVTRKGGRVEDVNISQKALAVLMEWISKRMVDDERVFMGLTYHDARKTLNKVGKRAGIALHPHIFRHSRAVQLLLDGAEMNVVKDHLGHLNIATTMNIYGRLRAVDIKGRLKSW